MPTMRTQNMVERSIMMTITRQLVLATSIQLTLLSPLTESLTSIPFINTKRLKSFSNTLFSSSSSSLPASSPVIEKKAALFTAISNFESIRERDGTVSIDFGVKGGELDSETRAPSIVNYYTVSDNVGKAADQIFKAIHELVNATESPPDATRFLGTSEGALCPLHGAWNNKFTNAADAVFSKNSTRGDANVYNVLDGVTGTIWNVIDFKSNDDGDDDSSQSSPSPLEQLRVKLSARATSPTRVEFVFRYVKARVNRLPLIPLFGRKVTLTIPVPGPFLTRILFFFRRGKKSPPAYFDILYLDDDLRIHKTAQGAYFVQVRPDWSRVL